MGGIGLLGTRPSQEAVEKCDTLFIVGSSFPHEFFHPKPEQARRVQIDIDASRIGLHYPIDGVLEPRDGCLWPDPSRPGLGLELKPEDAVPYRVG